MATSIQPQTPSTPEADALLAAAKPKPTPQPTTPPLPGVSPAAAPYTGGVVNNTATTANASPSSTASLAPAPAPSTTTASMTPATPPASTPSLPGVQPATPSAMPVSTPVSTQANIGSPPAVPTYAYQDGRYSAEGGRTGFGAQMAGRVFLDDGTEAAPGSIPAGYLLTPEAAERLRNGYAVSLTRGGGANYIATDAVSAAGQSGPGGRGTPDGGVQMFGKNMEGAPSINPVSETDRAAAAQRGSGFQGASADQLAAYNRQAMLESLLAQGASPAQLEAQGYDGALSGYVDVPGNPLDQIQFPKSPTTTGPVPPSAPSSGPVVAPPSGGPPPPPMPPGAAPPPAVAPPAPGSSPPETVVPRSASVPSLPGVSAPSTSLTPYTAENNLTDKTISRASGADRFQLAQDQWDAFQRSTNPAYEAELRDANRMAAAGGALGSGKLQSSIGDLATNRANQLDSQRTNLLTEALNNAIADSFGDASLAERQQQFQAGRSDTAFGQGVQQTQLEEALRNGDFSRALAALTAGSSGNPADIDMALSQIFGSQASEAGKALAELIKNTMANKTGATGSTTTNSLVQTMIDALKPGGGAAPQPISTGVDSLPGDAGGYA